MVGTYLTRTDTGADMTLSLFQMISLHVLSLYGQLRHVANRDVADKVTKGCCTVRLGACAVDGAALLSMSGGLLSQCWIE
jgi:hypothetical protein